MRNQVLKFRLQIDLQQTDEGLRRVRNEIINLNIQIRKYQQDLSRAKLILDAAEARLKILKGEEFDLNQNSMRQKRVFYGFSRNKTRLQILRFVSRL